VFAARLAGVAARHDDVDRASDPDEQHGESREAPRAVGQDRAVVVADVDDDIQPGAAMRGDGVVQGGVEGRNERRGGVIRFTGAQPHARPVSRRGDLAHEDIDAEIHPRPVEGPLDRGDDARLSGPRRAVEDDDLPRHGVFA